MARRKNAAQAIEEKRGDLEDLAESDLTVAKWARLFLDIADETEAGR